MGFVRDLLDRLYYYMSFGYGPDPRIRKEVVTRLQERPPMGQDEWYTHLWSARAIPKQIVDFLFAHLPAYCGLESSRLLPSDRFNEDLRLDRICFPDWGYDLREDFKRQYGVDIFKAPELEAVHTLEDLARVLARCAGIQG